MTYTLATLHTIIEVFHGFDDAFLAGVNAIEIPGIISYYPRPHLDRRKK